MVAEKTTPLLPVAEVHLSAPQQLVRGKQLRGVKQFIVPAIKRLKYGDSYNAAETMEAALENDPLQIYIRETPDYVPPSPRVKRMNTAILAVNLCMAIRAQTVLTIERGESMIVAQSPKDIVKGPTDRMLGWLAGWLAWIVGRTSSQNSQQRTGEVNKKLMEAVERGVGDRAKKMMHVSILMTHPTRQGRGYGGALLETITHAADLMGQATYLESSNVANAPFYESHGFKTVSEATVGSDDPTWKRPPVVISVMVREPQSNNEKSV